MSFLQWMRQALQQQNQQPCDQQDDECCNEEYYVEGGYDEELEREAGNVGYGYRDFISSDDDDSVMAKPARRATRAQTRAQAAAAAAASAAQNTGTAGQQQQQQTATVSDEESEAVYESLSSSPSYSGSEEEVDQSPAQPVVVSSPNTDVSPDNSGGGRGKTPSAASGGRKTPTPSVVGSVTGPKTPPPQPPPPPGRKTPEPPKTPPGRTPGGNTPRQSTPGRGGRGGLVTPVTLGWVRKKNVVSVAGSNLGPGGDVAAAALPDVGVGGGVNAFTRTGGVLVAAAAAAAAGGRSTGAAPTAESDLYWTGYVAHSARRAATEPDGLDPPADVMEMDTSDESDASFDGGGDGGGGGGGPGGDDGARKKKVWAEEGMRKAVRESELPAVRYDENGNVIPDLEREKNRRRLGLGEVFNDNKGFYKAVKELMQMGVFGQKETEAVVRAWREGLGLGTVGKDRKEREQWKKEWEGMKNVKWDKLNGKEYGSMKKKEWKLKGQRKGVSKLFRDKVVFGEFGTQVETAHTWWGRYGKVPTRLVREFRGTGAGCRLQGLTWEGRLTKTDFEIFLRKWLEWRYGRFMEDRGASRRKRRAQERVERREKKRLRVDWQLAFLSF